LLVVVLKAVVKAFVAGWPSLIARQVIELLAIVGAWLAVKLREASVVKLFVAATAARVIIVAS